MSISKKHKSKVEKTKFKKYKDWSVSTLIITGVFSFLGTGFLGLLFAKVVPDFVELLTTNFFSLKGLGLMILLGVLGVAFWFFGCLAARCNGLIYDRWFE